MLNICHVMNKFLFMVLQIWRIPKSSMNVLMCRSHLSTSMLSLSFQVLVQKVVDLNKSVPNVIGSGTSFSKIGSGVLSTYFEKSH